MSLVEQIEFADVIGAVDSHGGYLVFARGGTAGAVRRICERKAVIRTYQLDNWNEGVKVIVESIGVARLRAKQEDPEGLLDN